MSTQPVPEALPLTGPAAATATGQPPGPSRQLWRRGRARHVVGGRPLWLMWPSAVLLVLIVVVPFAIAIYISFLQLDQYTLRIWLHAPFVGLANYVRALVSGNVVGASALTSLGVSIAFSVLTTLFIMPIGILAALTVNTAFRGRGIVRSVYLLPYVIPTFVNGLLWRMLFLNHTGLIDQGLAALHIGSRNMYWLLGPNSFWALVIADTWASWAFIYIMVLAGLQSISSDLYEAAEVDGATSWQKLIRVVLPQMRHILGLGVLLSTLNHFNNFTLPFVMFGTPPPVQADVLPLNIYVSSFQLFDFGLGAAMSVITLLLMLIPGVIYLRAMRLADASA